ncbi:hypothetical protein P7K49_007883 [Saguinus oedipus]|uniref:Uncharacterized protein n=1 Tax=Saguinus oedipus TaxID=9490 RepID=A0ABQ9VZQ1_SAGOE|nr:hypothetical protein P7K49_007883 [Saguinus oedipus]
MRVRGCVLRSQVCLRQVNDGRGSVRARLPHTVSVKCSGDGDRDVPETPGGERDYKYRDPGPRSPPLETQLGEGGRGRGLAGSSSSAAVGSKPQAQFAPGVGMKSVSLEGSRRGEESGVDKFVWDRSRAVLGSKRRRPGPRPGVQVLYATVSTTWLGAEGSRALEVQVAASDPRSAARPRGRRVNALHWAGSNQPVSRGRAGVSSTSFPPRPGEPRPSLYSSRGAGLPGESRAHA